MYIRSILLITLATGIASADFLSLGTSRASTSLALSGTFLAGVLTNIPAGVDATIIPRHGKKNKQGDGKKAEAAAQGTVVAAANQAATTGTAGGVCNGTAATVGNAQGNNKRAYGVPMYPRHKGQKKGKNAANGACGTNQGTAAASGAQGVAAATVVQGQGAAVATGVAKATGAA